MTRSRFAILFLGRQAYRSAADLANRPSVAKAALWQRWASVAQSSAMHREAEPRSGYHRMPRAALAALHLDADGQGNHRSILDGDDSFPIRRNEQPSSGRLAVGARRSGPVALLVVVWRLFWMMLARPASAVAGRTRHSVKRL